MSTTFTNWRNVFLCETPLKAPETVRTAMPESSLHFLPLFISKIIDRGAIFERSSFSLSSTCNLWIFFLVLRNSLYYGSFVFDVVLGMAAFICFRYLARVIGAISFRFCCACFFIVFIPLTFNLSNVVSVLPPPCLYSPILFRPISLMVVRHSLIFALTACTFSSVPTCCFFWKIIQCFGDSTSYAHFFVFVLWLCPSARHIDIGICYYSPYLILRQSAK